jgi:hypothetical protein
VIDGVAVFLYLFSSMGVTILIVWPADGLGAWVRERVLRRILPVSIKAVLDCYICSSVWIGLIAAPFWWAAGFHWSAVAWLALPAIFWLAMPESRSGR